MRARQFSLLLLKSKKRRREWRKKQQSKVGRRVIDLEDEHYVYLLFRQHLCRINLSSPFTCVFPSRFETVLFLPDMGLPVGMGAFTRDDGIYLFGGERLRKKIEFGREFAPSGDLVNFNQSVFQIAIPPSPIIPPRRVFRSTIPPRRVFQSTLSSMGGPKLGAKAVVIDGLVYTFTGKQHCFRGVVPSPRFECYNPSTDVWVLLPDPPFYDEIWPMTFLNLSVIGRKIYANSNNYYLVFDVDLKRWEDAFDCFPSKPFFPFEFSGSPVAEGEGGIFVAYSVEGLVAYTDSSLTSYQKLFMFETPPPDPETQFAFIRHLGGGIYCLVLFIPFFWDIHVTTFYVCPIAGETSFDACVIAHHIYDARKACGADTYPPTDVFTMCHSSKKSIDAVKRQGILSRAKRSNSHTRSQASQLC